MPIISHSRTAQVASQDLLRLHLDETASELIGSVEERHRHGRTYLYDRFRIGTEMKARYLGEGTPELRARLTRAVALKTDAQDRRKTMSRLARILRAEGFIGADRTSFAEPTTTRFRAVRAGGSGSRRASRGCRRRRRPCGSWDKKAEGFARGDRRVTPSCACHLEAVARPPEYFNFGRGEPQ